MHDSKRIENLLNQHLAQKNLILNNNLWRIQESPLGGRGVFANCDIKTGEIIFIDHPLIIGPRAKSNQEYRCVVCSKLDVTMCSNQCGLPICSSNCSESSMHLEECKFIRSNCIKKILEISPELYRSLAPLRGLFLDENSRELFTNLMYHTGQKHGFEVELVKQIINLTENEEEFMKIVCCVLDSNAFETIIKTSDEQVSARGLFPVSSLLNHRCFPNTTHLFNDKQQMIVKAAVPIQKDEEIFTSYTTLLWSTLSRRHHLYTTKHFWCECERCKDPKEFGCNLSGLKCISNDCGGIVYPIDALNYTSKWECDFCGYRVSSRNIGFVQSVMGSVLNTVDIKNAENLINAIKNQIGNVISLDNQLAVDLKLKCVWRLGNTKNFLWNDLTLDQLEFKEQLCKDLLRIVTNLRLGQCNVKGLLLVELYRCRLEKSRRETSLDSSTHTNKSVQDDEKLLEEAADILAQDISVPVEIQNILNRQKFCELVL